MVQMLVKYCRDQLNKQGITAEVDGRAKSLTSIKKSLERREEYRMRHQCKKYQDLGEIFDDIHDLAGVRIVVEYPADLDKATRFIRETFRKMKEPNVFSSDRQVGRLWKAWFGAYQSWNHRVSLKPEAPGVLQSYHSVMFEIQLTSLPERLYNKLAHPLLYKQSSGGISRKDEMVIDLSHGLALCYSLCVSYMQDKLGPSKGPGEQRRLRDAVTKATSTSKPDDSEVDMNALVDMIPDIGSGSNLKSLASFGETIPVEGFLSALKTPPERCCSTEDVWEQMINKLGSVIQAGNQTPLNLPTVENARYHSEDVQGSPKCHDGTRTVVRSTIRSWATDTDAETLFWLHAPAGTGKSTLARTLADEFYLAEELAAGYFFKRGDKLRNSTSRIFPTIASQLVEVIPRFGRLLRDSLERSQGTIETTSLEQQFNILLRTPLSGLRPPKGRKPTKVIIIDALDEWDFHQDIHRVLKLFSSLGDLGALRLCVLFTSRFAPPIANAFGVIQRAGTRLRTLALHEEFYEETKADIEAVLRDNLADIKRNAMIEKEPWPEDKEVEYVVSQATTPSPLFIYITTLIRFIAGERGLSDPVERFKTWLERCRGNESPLDHLYRTIVEDLRSEELLGKEKSTLSQILGVAVLLAVPLPAGAWAALLGIDSAKTWLRNLHAVISVPADDQAPVEIIHKSFSDFLLGNELPDTNPFKVDVSETHHMLARRCMVRSSEGLRKNICKLDSPAMSKHDILEGTIAKCIPNDLDRRNHSLEPAAPFLNS
ncbi:hypothetical protein BHE90_014871 [Fusarium euwallaceae]|uniref:RelA/SpoT domain-containing protein n=1 Tax=Fusarium euwallaceae TaxID=1147111 RepID=A0A430L4Y6_9HYPO|nr:hypothetical protein BHE90_014871 [Fusarium euwallaceae]